MKAYEEYQPTPHWDPTVGYYRTFRWGKNLEFFILDERSFKSPEVSHFPKVDPGDLSVCDNPPGSGQPDIAAALPQSLRSLFAAVSGITQLAPRSRRRAWTR